MRLSARAGCCCWNMKPNDTNEDLVKLMISAGVGDTFMFTNLAYSIGNVSLTRAIAT